METVFANPSRKNDKDVSLTCTPLYGLRFLGSTLSKPSTADFSEAERKTNGLSRWTSSPSLNIEESRT